MPGGDHPAYRASRCVMGSEREPRPDDVDQAVGDSLGLLLLAGLDHDADDRLGAGLAQQHPAGAGERLLLGLDRLLELLVGLDPGPCRRP